jgi:hypothetical protein
MTLWEGESHDTGNLASGGGMVRAKYRLTTRMLYFQRGTLSTRTEQVPLWAIRDVTIRQTMTQRKRGVGTIRVWVEHADFAGRVVVVAPRFEDSDISFQYEQPVSRPECPLVITEW